MGGRLLAFAGLAGAGVGQEQPFNCWADGVTRGQCCNEIHGSVGNGYCWDGGAYNFEACCRGSLYRAPDCSSFIANFGFSSLRYKDDWVERCAQKMETAPGLCNAPNITRQSCPSCAALSPHLLKFISCVRREQRAASPGGTSSDFAGATGAIVGGVHFPTVLRPRFPGRQFTYLAAAFDSYVGNQLISEGVWNANEARLLMSLVPEGGVAVDAGANIGGFTLPLAKHVGIDGEVHAFEPFRMMFQILTANCALNGLQSCLTHHKALGSRAGQKQVRMPSFNGIGNPSKMHVADEVASEMHVHYGTHLETVEVVPLDAVPLRGLNLLKIDVESMELELLAGAEQTLRRFRPAVYVEDSEGEGPKPTRVERLLSERHGYRCRDLAAEGVPGMTSLLCTPS